MRLDELFQVIPILERIHWDPQRSIGKITSDSRAVETGDVFVACPGTRMDGHDFLGQAIQAGASVIVFEKTPEFSIHRDVTAILVENSRECLSRLLQRYHHAPDQKTKLIGITGTNGKTTIAYLLYKLLKEKVGTAYLGTLGYEWPHQKKTAINTTPGPETLFPLLDQMQQADIQYCFMEVSSHSLDQRRVHGLEFELALFTHLTQDHLDYHHSMESYYQAKRLLFFQSPQPRQILVNRDCPYARRLIEERFDAKSYSLKSPATFMVSDVNCTMQGSHFQFKYGKRKVPFKIRLPLQYNVSNVLAVLGVLQLLGFDPEEFRAALQELPGVPGRLERILGTGPLEIFVDYAHTPDAVERVLEEAQQLSSKRVLTLLGCGGDRDQDKRPLMAAAAMRYSDLLIMTSDNPRSEDPENILGDMRRGIPAARAGGAEVMEVLDRRAAIQKLISLAEPGDVLFVLGKGHEDFQILGEKKIPFDDRRVIQECLKRKSRVSFS